MQLAPRLAALSARPASPAAGSDEPWRPRLFRLDDDADAAALAALLDAGAVRTCRDSIRAQVADLLRARSPWRPLAGDALAAAVDEQLGAAPERYGTWAFFPWSGALVHTLPEPDFRFLRSDRNRHKITPAEQERLAGMSIGVVGLSVGLSAAATLALEGVARRFHLADFDALGLSNLNRLRAGIDALDLNKAVIAARQLYELDPYLDIRVFPDGLTDENLDAFLGAGGGRPISLLVEECDDLYMKVRVRERARELRIPVVMETSERGMIDVERFDREPDRPILHGLVGDVPAGALRALPAKEKIPFITNILDAQRMSVSGAASLVEVGETISTWPQLGSSIALSGALIADTARRILLDKLLSSGRWYVDLEQLVDGAGVPIKPGGPPALRVSAEAVAPRAIPPRPAPGREGPTPDEIRWLIAHAVLAPSGGNSQPWRFRFEGGRLLCLAPDGPETFLDFAGASTRLAIGAAVENIALAAPALGLRPRVVAEADPDRPALIASIAFDSAGSPPASPAPIDPLLAEVPRRETNRKPGRPVPLDPAHAEAMARAAAAHGGRIRFLTNDDARAALGRVLGEGDRFTTLHEALSAELGGELRWTPEEVERTRDGFDVATTEASPGDLAAMRVASAWPVLAYVRDLGGGRAFTRRAEHALAASSAAALVTIDGTGPAAYFQGGRAMQRAWLAASACGLAVQPWSALLYLWLRLARGGGGFTPEEAGTLARLRGGFRALFEVGEGESELLLMRLAYADPPSARSIRRRPDEVLSFG